MLEKLIFVYHKLNDANFKLNIPVSFPLTNLDLNDYVEKKNSNAVYDLFAVSNHHGSLSNGHYTGLLYYILWDRLRISEKEF